MTAQTATHSATWAAKAPQITPWTPALADDFPGCHQQLLDGEIPATVIEVRNGWPVRVTFADAWARTHDEDSGNHGRVIALCR